MVIWDLACIGILIRKDIGKLFLSAWHKERLGSLGVYQERSHVGRCAQIG